MWRKLCFQNKRLEEGVSSFLQSGGGRIDHESGLIVPGPQSMSYNGNWLFFSYTTMLRDCYLWHNVMFRHFRLVPDYCRLRCYKVVVKVRNFTEAMDFYNLMNSAPYLKAEISPLPGKVGIDERHYSDGHFNGFIYCDGLEDALDRYKIVRNIVNEHMSDGYNIPIIIKRSCTEFELEYGDTSSPFWQAMPSDEFELQKRIEDIFEGQRISAVQPDWLKNRIVLKFARWANTVGDKSWVEYFGEDFLTMKAVTYHHLIKGEDQNGTGKNSDDPRP